MGKGGGRSVSSLAPRRPTPLLPVSQSPRVVVLDRGIRGLRLATSVRPAPGRVVFGGVGALLGPDRRLLLVVDGRSRLVDRSFGASSRRLTLLCERQRGSRFVSVVVSFLPFV